MIIWFTALALMGASHIFDDPTVLKAINPYYAVQFMLTHGTIGLVTLGAGLPGRDRRRGALC
jgi:KUP system potassium uptake protein